MGFIKIGIVQVKKENEYRITMTNQIHRKFVYNMPSFIQQIFIPYTQVKRLFEKAIFQNQTNCQNDIEE